jgi:exonuclease III
MFQLKDTDWLNGYKNKTHIYAVYKKPTSHQWTDHQNRKLKRKHVLNDTLDEMGLTDIFRTFHPNAEEYTFFSSAHGTFSRIDHILSYKSNFSRFKKIEIISSIFSDHNAMSLDINYKKKPVRNTNTWI